MEKKPNMLQAFRAQFAHESVTLLKDYALILLGTLLGGISFNQFFLPYSLAPGGISGIATILASLLPLSVGLFSFLLNVPLFLLGWRTVGWRFAFRSFIAMTLLSVFIDIIPSSDLSGSVMLASVFGGTLLGVGLGLVVRAGATTGGTDMAAKMIHQHIGFASIPAILLAIDGAVILLAAVRFGIPAGLWALIAVFICTQAMDAVIRGFNTAMQFMIISRHADDIIRVIHSDLDRGCTRLMAEGTYSGQPVGTLLCVVSRLEAPHLKRLIAQIDPDAFVTVCSVNEALGEGFTGIDAE